MIDTHCHLDGVDNPQLSAQALEAVVAIGHTPEHARACLVLAKELVNVFVVVGLHPTDADQDSPLVRQDIEDLAGQKKVVGIGESGLDYYWDKASRDAQVSAFEWQLALARSKDLPIVIHARDKENSRAVFKDCAAILKNAAWPKGILHCFAGDDELLQTGLELGFYVSFAGNLTYKNAQILRDVAKNVPHTRLLVETDAPYLAPVPMRGKANRPEFVRHTLQVLADVHALPFEEMERITSQNARVVYGLPG